MVTHTRPASSSEGQQKEEGEAPAAAAAAAPEQEYTGGDAETNAATKKKNKKKNKKNKKKRAQNNRIPDVVIYATVSELETVKVTQDAVSGRCVVASRDLEVGELVVHEPPFAKVVRRDCAGRQCANCCRQVTEGGKIEADVPFAVYCCRACKAEEAALRSEEAAALGKLAGICAARDVDVDLLRMVLRLLITRAKALGLGPADNSSSQDREEHEEGEGGATQEGSFLLEQWGNLHALMHHREAGDPQWIAVVRAAAEDLLEIIPEWARIDVEEVVQLACRVNVNAHGLRDDSGSNLVIGVGLFPLTAMINHSCRPNCTFVYFGGQMEVRTLEPVSAGTELSLYYIDLLQSTTARRKELLVTKHFLCKCSRCESPGAVDEYLDGVCCVDCGPTSCLSSNPPPSPEDILAAQLAELGEIESATRPAERRGSGKGKGNNPKGGGGNGSAAGTGNGGVSSASSTAPSAMDVNSPSNGVGGGGSEGVMYCSTCRRQYPARAIEESVARAKASWDGAMTVLRAKNFPLARKTFEKWLQDHDAGSVPPPTAAKAKSLKKKDRVKLHPTNAMVVQTLVPLSNCCNFEEDHSASARHLRRAVSAMEAVYPPNYPELGDFHAALADANTAFLEKRGQTLPKKSRSQTVSERKQALQRAAAIRTVCLGKEHPTTKEAVAALDRA